MHRHSMTIHGRTVTFTAEWDSETKTLRINVFNGPRFDCLNLDEARQILRDLYLEPEVNEQ